MPRFEPTKSLLVLLACLFVAAACAPTGIYHTVQPGQTLYRIAKIYEVDEARLASINGIRDPAQLKARQRLFIPGASQPRSVPSTAGVSASPPQAAPAAVPLPSVVSKPAARPPTSGSVPAGTPAKGMFVWPAKGKLLNGFGSQGQKVYKGIEIALPRGTAVVAAASGKVIYSGDAIPGYGNLVILEHSDNFFSVYGYNQKNLVKLNDHVGQGEKIALSGLPPSGQSARLHFEIRKGKSAVNPILYLP